jgi:PAS domain S-box-containing protein
MKDKSLRVLVVEDLENDALLLIRELKKGGYNPVYERVETAAAMKKSLKEKQWDIILCDYTLPKFSGPSAIALLREINIDIPILIVSGTIGEETAIECMRLGAQDYIMKSKMSRLCPAIARELVEVKSREKRKLAENLIKESEEKYRLLADHMTDLVWLMDLNLKWTYISPSIEKVMGYNLEELVQLPLDKLLTATSFQLAMDVSSRELAAEMAAPQPLSPKAIMRLECRCKDGHTVWIESTYGFIRDENLKPLFIIGEARDITERMQAEELLKQSEAKYRLLADHVTDVIFTMDMNFQYTYLSPSISQLIGYTADELLTMRVTDIVSPETFRFLTDVFMEEMEVEKRDDRDLTRSRMLEYQHICKDGSKVWVETKITFLRDNNNTAAAILGSTRNISIRKQSEMALAESFERLKKSFGVTIKVLVAAIEMKDPYTSGHQSRSANVACAIATEMGLDEDVIEGIGMAGTIHDIGKLSIPAEILTKPLKLTELEYSLIKEHSNSGFEMLKDVESPWPLAEIVHQHHERMNGTGYPGNLKGDEIILEARILAVADVVEAMASNRPYRPSLGIKAALEEIEKNKGILYDVTVADACLRLFRDKGYQLT